MTKNDLIKKLETKHLSWAWFAVLSYEGLPSRPIDSLFYTWIEEVEREDGDADFQWCRILNPYNKEELERVCFYVLVRGLSPARRNSGSADGNSLPGTLVSLQFTTHLAAISPKALKEHLSQYGDFKIQYCLGPADVKWGR